MFSQIFVLITLGASCVIAASVNDFFAPVEIVKSKNEQSPDGGYKFEFEQDDGQKREEEGTLKNTGPGGEPSLSVRGSYSFTGEDGVVYKITYVADENGFQPVGDHIPKANYVPTASADAAEFVSVPEVGSTALLSLIG